MRRSSPAISVVMPVHNALPFLDEAVASILGQSFADFEFVILDDASADGSAERLSEWAAKDDRIRLIRSKTNLGPIGSSERVASEAKAPVVARMDADDVSLPDRLEAQFAVLQANPKAAAVGCLSDIIDAQGRQVRGPEHWRASRPSFSLPFAHGATMYRRDIFERAGGYREGTELWEDQDLLGRMSGLGEVLVIPRRLYRVRLSRTSTRSRADLDRQEQALDEMYRSRLQISAGDGRIDPRAFVALGSVILWSGGRPRLFRRLIRRGRLGFDLRSLGALGWTGWASVSPASLRAALRLLLAVRNTASRRRAGIAALPWRRPAKPVAGRGAQG